MPRIQLSTAQVLDVRAGYRLVDRTDAGPDEHVFCVERDTGNGWTLVQAHADQSAALEHFETCTAVT